MCPHQFGRDGKTEAGAAAASRSLESFEQMLARLGGKSRSGVGDLDHHHGAFTATGDANLGVAGGLSGLAVERLHGIAPEIEQHAEQLIRIGIDLETALEIAALEREGAELREMRAARARLHTPDYGVCADCGADIPYARLEITPAATRCVGCQSRSERTQGTGVAPTL